jgi:hypothetical protein
MNEYDPMKDGASEQAQRHQSKAERQNTGGDPDGREYTNPDGSHGYVYNAQNVYRDSNHLNFRNAFITVLTLLIALILAICCLGGAMIASLSLEAEESTQGSADGDGTSNGIFISDETDSENENGTELYPSVPGGNHNTQDHETAPDLDSITKLPPERVDENGDGRPDIVFGEDGQVLTSAGTGILTVATVVARVADSVVEITAETVTQSDWVKPAVSSGAGSGVIISHEGYIFTEHISFCYEGNERAFSPDVFRIRQYASFQYSSYSRIHFAVHPDVIVFFIPADPAPKAVKKKGAVSGIDPVKQRETGKIYGIRCRHILCPFVSNFC